MTPTTNKVPPWHPTKKFGTALLHMEAKIFHVLFYRHQSANFHNGYSMSSALFLFWLQFYLLCTAVYAIMIHKKCSER